MKALFTLLFLLTATTALACPVCDTPNGTAVREGIFNESFWVTFVEVASPFPVLGILIFALHRYLPD